MAKAMMNDLLVILPGITGSVLAQWQGRLERVMADAVVGDAQPRRFAPIARTGGRRSRSRRGADGVTATALIEIPHLVAGLAKVYGYTNLFETLTE